MGGLLMNPAIWLVIWLASTALACLLTAWAVYQVGYDHGHDEATDLERGRHRVRPAAPEPEPRQHAPWEQVREALYWAATSTTTRPPEDVQAAGDGPQR